MAVLLSEALSQQNVPQRAFYGLADIKQVVRQSKHFARDGASPENAAALLLLSTGAQQTWLVASARRLYCVLDDPRKGPPTVNWSLDRSDLVEDGVLKVSITTHDNTDRTGKVDIGPQKGWLYSRALFEGRDVTAAIRDLVLGKMSS